MLTYQVYEDPERRSPPELPQLRKSSNHDAAKKAKDIDEEKKTNIFLRCNEPSIKNALNLNNASEQEIFSKLRDLKDSF